MSSFLNHSGSSSRLQTGLEPSTVCWLVFGTWLLVRLTFDCEPKAVADAAFNFRIKTNRCETHSPKTRKRIMARKTAVPLAHNREKFCGVLVNASPSGSAADVSSTL